MASVKWKIQRLRAMSAPEVYWRLAQKRIQNIEKKTFAQNRIAVTEAVFNKELSNLEFQYEKLGLNYGNSKYGLNTEIRLLAGAKYSDYKTRWSAGFQTKNTWPNDFSYDIEYRQRDDIGDARTNWELNRHFQFALLAKNYAASGDKRYLEEFVSLFRDWNEKNPFLHGISWTSVMEVAIRCSNWCYSLAFLSRTNAPEVLLQELRIGVVNMTDYIANHYSRYSSANNHLIVEMYAIGQSGILFNKPEWLELAVNTLSKELLLQNCSDGINKEASLHYQAFYMEAMGLMMRLLRRNQIQVPESWTLMLKKMSRFVADCKGDYGEVIAFGDDDEGKIIDLKGNWTDHYQYVLGMMSILLDETYVSDYECETIRWLFTEDEICGSEEKKKYTSPQYCCYKEGGYTILRSSDRKVLIGIDHADLGYGVIAAHGHADALSFQLFYEGQPIFIDPGTYIYHCDIENRNNFRKTCNHNTVCVDGKDQSEMLGAFLWGRKASARIISLVENTNSIKLTLIHDGYKPVEHIRIFEFDSDRHICIKDIINEQNTESMGTLLIAPDINLYEKNNEIEIKLFEREIGKIKISAEKTIESGHYYSIKYGVFSLTDAIKYSVKELVTTEVIFR